MKQGFTRNRRSQYRTVKCKGNSRDWLSRGTGGRPSRSSEEVCESKWSEGLGLFGFYIFNKQELR
jgi:hypothetical protein